MNILVACEYSGIVRDAFIAKGHNATSCDLLPTEQSGPHYQGDIRDILYPIDFKWDMLIAFPPCTYLCRMGATWINRQPGRKEKREEALQFVKELWASPIEKIAIENSIGYLSTMWQQPTQIIQPWMFGENKSKMTCLWLKNLPPLMASMIETKYTVNWVNTVTKGTPQQRAHVRSKTFQGIADAMAEQWR